MARGKTDQEMLALQRCMRTIEELEDPRAQVRIASYLLMRFTSASESHLPSEERGKHFAAGFRREEDPRQMTIPGTISATPGAASTTPPATSAAGPATPPAVTSGKPAAAAAAAAEPTIGDVMDEPASPARPDPKKGTKVKKPDPEPEPEENLLEDDADGDAEIEVKI